LTSESVGLTRQHQVVLMCRQLTRMQSGVNLPLSEVIMSRVCRDKPARCEGVQVSNSEGLANHAGPESCASLGNGVREALTGECAGRVLSPEIGQFGCRRAPNTRKATAGTPLRRGVHAPGGVEDPWHARKHRERDPGAPASGLAHRSKARTVNRKATTVRYGRRESDSSIGPAKRPNHGTYEL
jgi:hypothetical protein